MKLARLGIPGAEKPAILLDNGRYADLSSLVDDISCGSLLPEGLARVKEADLAALPLLEEGLRIGPCVGQIQKFICVGLNYFEHAKETGLPVPQEPILFQKATSAISGPNDPIIMPPRSTGTDYEVELGIVIGRPAKYVSENEAADHIAGYCLVNDVSERNYQKYRGGQWTKGKSADSFGPIGPWLVTSDEIDDPDALSMWLDVNGERRQQATTADMIFNSRFLVHYVSQFMTLQTGDVIATGTPSGIGSAIKPAPVFLKHGDTVTLSIEGLGTQTQNVLAYERS
ncbi:fumarylacetoacetate hydrolase family protein [Pelagibacterium sediminicola]|uniref:fumarylacetoacetate hydrolase family protein n=1 Tax=Pelagibacterium sediminicola TaxID=2248761 RepID=UPI000E30D370|nr:fumarylacetoacetate hydrolase family protein [Pelagibacterium sediminicola]